MKSEITNVVDDLIIEFLNKQNSLTMIERKAEEKRVLQAIKAAKNQSSFTMYDDRSLMSLEA